MGITWKDVSEAWSLDTLYCFFSLYRGWGGPWWWIQKTVLFRSGCLHGRQFFPYPINDVHVEYSGSLLQDALVTAKVSHKPFSSTSDWFMLWPPLLCPPSSQWLPSALAHHGSGAWSPRPASFLCLCTFGLSAWPALLSYVNLTRSLFSSRPLLQCRLFSEAFLTTLLEPLSGIPQPSALIYSLHGIFYHWA